METYFETFDATLKYQAERHPQDFLRFASGDPQAEVLRPVSQSLPSRGRDIDACYLVRVRGRETVAHTEFHRRNQGWDELATDVAEAQVRLYRREQRPVLSLVWDLYGHRTWPVLSEKKLEFGCQVAQEVSQCVYQLVNLRGLTGQKLLAEAPPALWPLIALTADGTEAEWLRKAAEAIEARPDLSPGERADHRAVLYFLARAENVPKLVLEAIMIEESLKESDLYRDVFAKWLEQGKALGEAKGEAKGEVQGEAKSEAKTIISILTHRLGMVPQAVQEQVRNLTDPLTRQIWYSEALLATSAEEARRLVDKIRGTIC